MRPPAIIRFEQAAYASLALSLIGPLTADIDTSASPSTVELPLGQLILFHLGALALSVLLIWLIARKASRLAKWIYVLLAATSIIFQLLNPEWLFETGGTAASVILGQDLLILFALWMLFRPEANAWFRGEYAGVDTEIFR